MSDLFDNPMGTDGFDFCEFAAPDGKFLHELFKNMGFTAIAKHKSQEITHYRQGQIDFLVNEDPDSFAYKFSQKHGPCCSGFALRVKNASRAYEIALEKQADPVSNETGCFAIDIPMIRGIGGSILYLVDQYGESSILDDDFEPLPGVDQRPFGFGLTELDHLTHNVEYGNMRTWFDFYERLFNFKEIRYFDIKGIKTGLLSRALTAPCGKIRIPLNESSDEKSQINEYLREYNGEGVQHIACYTEDIYATVEAMRKNHVAFLETPDAYYEVIDQRVAQHEEDLPRMKKNNILIDADQETKTQLLLQIFTQNYIGPIFFEIIQRKGNDGFGEGNFKALFESIEREQMRRGVL